MNVIFNCNSGIYNSYIILVVSFFTLSYAKLYENRVESLLRFNTKKDYQRHIFNNTIIIGSLIYLLSIVLLIITHFIGSYFVLGNGLYFLYNCSSLVYCIWVIIRNYLFLLLVINYLIKFLFSFKLMAFIYLLSVVLLLLFPISIVFDLGKFKPVFMTYYMNYRNFGSLYNEIVTFICSLVIKFYLYLILIYVIERLKIKND